MTRLLPPPEICLAGALVAGGLGFWSAVDGGIAETVWYPVGILLLVLLAILAWGAAQRRLGRATKLAIGAFGGFTAWSYLSILWAANPSTAFSGANKTLVYLIVLLVVARQRWQAREAGALVVVWALTVTAVGAASLGHAAFGSHAASAFSSGRLAVPIDYANANAALFVLAAWPTIVAAQNLRVPPALRVLCLGAAGVAVELAILAQSKGAVIATAVTVPVFLLTASRRARAAVPIFAIAAIVAVLHGPLFAVYTRLTNGEDASSAIRRAVETVALSFAGLVAAGVVIVVLERQVFTRAPRVATLCARLAAALTFLGLVAGALLVVVELGSPATLARHAWHAFRHPAATSSASSHFVTGAGNHRYDFWRVAAHQFESAPLLGRGVDSFAADYARLRRSPEQPAYPHSLEARLLGGTGIVGFLLFGVFVAAAVAICLTAARSSGDWAPVGLIGIAMFAYWLIHGSVDWLWEFPSLTGPAVMALGCAAGAERVKESPPVRGWTSRLTTATAVVAAVGAGVALVPAWLSARGVSQAIGEWRTSPAASFATLRQAAALNPLSDQPYVLAGTIAERRRDWPSVERYFRKAVARNPTSWYALLEIGVAEAKTGRRAEALANLRRAARLDPREPTIQQVLSAVAAGRSFSVRALDAAFVAEGNLR